MAREEGPRNPRMDDEDEFENLGNATGITCVEGVDHANVKEVDFGNKCFSQSILPPLHGNAESYMGFEEGLVLSNSEEMQVEYQADGLFLDTNKLMDTNGPSSSRPRTTWTCINRMDFGLGGLARAFMLPSLGKRDTRTTSSGQDEDHQTKRGRVEEWKVEMLWKVVMLRYQRGWIATLARSNEVDKLELSRAWDPLDK